MTETQDYGIYRASMASSGKTGKATAGKLTAENPNIIGHRRTVAVSDIAVFVLKRDVKLQPTNRIELCM